MGGWRARVRPRRVSAQRFPQTQHQRARAGREGTAVAGEL